MEKLEKHEFTYNPECGVLGNTGNIIVSRLKHQNVKQTFTIYIPLSNIVKKANVGAVYERDIWYLKHCKEYTFANKNT